jgi:hypothetical protein
MIENFTESTYVKKYEMLHVKAAYTHEFKDRKDSVWDFATRKYFTMRTNSMWEIILKFYLYGLTCYSVSTKTTQIIWL